MLWKISSISTPNTSEPHTLCVAPPSYGGGGSAGASRGTARAACARWAHAARARRASDREVLGKFSGSALAARWTGLTWREAGALGTLMNTRGLVELVILNIGFDLGVISPTLYTMMVLMALLTTFMTSPILERLYPQRLHLPELVYVAEEPQVRPIP